MSDLYERGHETERKYARLVASRGGVALPLCEALGNTEGTRAPMAWTARGKWIAPDFLVFQRGRVFWAEVKGKLQPGYFFKGRRWEHGLDYHLVEHYSAIQEASGAPVWIVSHEEHSPPDDDAAPSWDERFATPYSVVVPSGVWLCVKLDAAISAGIRRLKWPDDKGGKYGQGGLLWPRRIMRVFSPGGEP